MSTVEVRTEGSRRVIENVKALAGWATSSEVVNAITPLLQMAEQQAIATYLASEEAEKALAAAIDSIWPSHAEGIGGTGNAENRTWQVKDPAIPNAMVARAVLKAWRTTE